MFKWNSSFKTKTGFSAVEFLGDVSFHGVNAIDGPIKSEGVYRIVNFESFFISGEQPRFEIQSNLDESIELLKSLEVNCISLANNHSLDGDGNMIQEFVSKADLNGFDVIGLKRSSLGYDAIRLTHLARGKSNSDLIVVGAINEGSFVQLQTCTRSPQLLNLMLLNDLLVDDNFLSHHNVIVFLHGGITYDFNQKRLWEQVNGNKFSFVVAHAHVPGIWREENGQTFISSLGNLIFNDFVERVPGEMPLIYRNSLVERISLGFEKKLNGLEDNKVTIYRSKYTKGNTGEDYVEVTPVLSLDSPRGQRLLVLCIKLLKLQMIFNKIKRKLTRMCNKYVSRR
jgi:hypothetical protein